MIKEIDLPEGWNVVELPEVVFFQEGPGVRKHQFTDKGIKLLNGRNIVDNKLILDNTETYISREEATTKYNHFLVEEGDLIIASSGIKVDYFHKKIAFAKKEHLPLCMNTSTIRFRSLNTEILDIQYFRYFLMTHLFASQVNFHITGSAQLNFGPTHLKKMKVILPPLQTQKKIVAILEKAERLKKWKKEADELTDEFLKSTFLEMFGDPVKNEKNWIKTSLIEFGTWKSGGTPYRKNKHFFEGDIPWYTSGELNSIYISDSLEKISMEAIENSNAKLIPPNSLLVGMYDTAALKSSITTILSSCNQAIAYSELEYNKINIIYLYFAIQIGRKFFMSKQRGVRQKNLNLTMVKNTKIPLPPLELQQKFASIVQQVEQLRKHQNQSKQHIDDLFNALMQKAFRGELEA